MSSFGCADEWCREVEVIGEVQVYVPSGFTPDNDGVNDLFLPSVTPLEQVEDYRLEVYNRWGDLVFATQNPEEGMVSSLGAGVAAGWACGESPINTVVLPVEEAVGRACRS